MKIVIESHIPFIRGVFERAGIEVRYLSPDEFTPENVADADALIVRTRTRCDASLLADSCCRFVATATIGTDHIDLDWCRNHGITVANAPGCNAPAVAQWVFASIFTINPTLDPTTATLGVVGVGNVGRIVARWGRSLGFKVLECDPPRAQREGSSHFVDLRQIASDADIITFHTPLTRHPDRWPTFHIADDSFFASLCRRPILLNAARGAVVDTRALIRAHKQGLTSQMAIDCWEGEPAVNPELLQLATIATPHIAGYSAQGKIRATQMAIDAVCNHFNLPPLKADAAVPAPIPENVTRDMILSTYDPRTDTKTMRSAPELFEALRNNYALREEPIVK